MKITIIPNSINNIDDYTKIGANAFIFGLKGYSSGYNNSLTLEEIKKIKSDSYELFIAINKNIFNSELEELERIMKELDEIKINGILFYDMAVLNIKKKNNLSLDLVWNQTHMVTNYNTCNYYYSHGVKYGVLASEITLDEINEIKEKTDMKLFLNVMGYQIMSYTRRKLLGNYYKSIGKEKIKNKNIITNNNEEYILNEEENGNAIYYGKPLNGSIIIPKLDLDYIILNEDNFEHDKFIKITDLFNKLLEYKDEKYIKEIDDLIGDYRGFFFTKTIYKVKKNG